MPPAGAFPVLTAGLLWHWSERSGGVWSPQLSRLCPLELGRCNRIAHTGLQVCLEQGPLDRWSLSSLKWDMGGEGQDPPSALAVITPPSRPNQLPSIPASPPLSACLPQDPLIPEEVGFYPFLFLSGLPLHKTLTPNLTLVLKVFVLTALILGVIKYPGVQIKDPGPSSGV